MTAEDKEYLEAIGLLGFWKRKRAEIRDELAKAEEHVQTSAEWVAELEFNRSTGKVKP